MLGNYCKRFDDQLEKLTQLFTLFVPRLFWREDEIGFQISRDHVISTIFASGLSRCSFNSELPLILMLK